MSTLYFALSDALDRCATCDAELHYGENTTFEEKLKAHRCMKCGTILK